MNIRPHITHLIDIISDIRFISLFQSFSFPLFVSFRFDYSQLFSLNTTFVHHRSNPPPNLEPEQATAAATPVLHAVPCNHPSQSYPIHRKESNRLRIKDRRKRNNNNNKFSHHHQQLCSLYHQQRHYFLHRSRSVHQTHHPQRMWSRFLR